MEADQPDDPELSSRHLKTLAEIFEKPTRSNIRWGDFVAFMEAAGADVDMAGGSAHSFFIHGRIIVIHKPHPGSEMAKGAVKRVRAFLSEVGIEP